LSNTKKFLKKIYSQHHTIIYMIVYSCVNSLIVFLIPKFTINFFGIEAYSQFVVFNTIIDIILKFSIIDISDLNLKIKKKNIF